MRNLNKFFFLLISNPIFLLNKIYYRLIRKSEATFFIPKSALRFIKHNKIIWREWKNSKYNSKILYDIFEGPEVILPYSYFLNVLAKKYNSEILSFSYKSNVPFKKMHASFNSQGNVKVKLTSINLIKRKQKYLNDAKNKIKCKNDVYNYKINDVWIGIDIYESYLREGLPTIDLNDKYFWDIFDKGLMTLIFWEEYFQNNKVAAVVLSHDSYIYYNIIAKVCYKNKVNVYFPSLYNFQMSNEPHALYKTRFQNYKIFFESLRDKEQENGIKIAQKQLEKRLGGEIGVNMSYSMKSAFGQSIKKNRVFLDSSKKKVLICTHCFFDNPHGYGGMLFLDFYEWLVFLGKISEKVDYEMYIKPHPDYLPGTKETIYKIIKNFPKIIFIEPDVSFHQMVKEGLDTVLTCFGSVGHEMALLDIKVINAAYNPHSAFDFNYHAKSIDEYEKVLLDIDSLHIDFDKNEVYKFYYINYYYVMVDDIFLPSLEKFEELKLEQDPIYKNNSNQTNHNYFTYQKINIYDYFRENFSQQKHDAICNKILKFIDSQKNNYFINGPE